MQFPAIKDIIKATNKEEYSKYLAFMPDLKQEKTKKFTTIVLTLTASMILGIFAISPTLSTIANLQKQIGDNKFVDQKLVEKIYNLSVLQQKYTNLANDLSVVYDAIPSSAQIAPLVAEIQTIAQSSNIKLNSFQTYTVDFSNKKTSDKKYFSFDFGLSGEGSYSDIASFIDQLLNFQRIIAVDNISISKINNDQENNGNLQLNFKGSALFKE
jgi:Tfp pilus assembly protein PilO